MGLAEILIEHQDRAVVRLGDVFVKVEADTAKATREHELLQMAPVRVPEVLWWSPGTPSLLALARVPGSPLSASTSPGEWRGAGRLVRKLHDAPAPDWPPWLHPGIVRRWLDDDRDWLLEHAVVDPPVVEAAHAMAAEVLTERAVDPVLTHRDLQAAHVFVEDGEVTGIIDWGDVGVGDGLYDLATLTVRHRDRLDEVLGGYGDADRDVIRAWWAERLLGEPRWLVERGFDPAESLAGLRSLV